MKKIITLLLLVCFWFTWAIAYEATTKDFGLMNIIRPMLDELPQMEKEKIGEMLVWVINKEPMDSKKSWYARLMMTHMFPSSLDWWPEVLSILDEVFWENLQLNTPIVEVWDSIAVNYVWSLTDWTIFDTSRKEVAIDAWLYNPARTYVPLEFTVWAKQMIAWFDSWVVWMKLWETKTLIIQPEDAYWFGDHPLAWEILEFWVKLEAIYE